MDHSPLPQPHSYTCSQCGKGWDRPQKYCPFCGYPQRLPAQIHAPVSGCLLAFLCLVALALGGLGGCAILLGEIVRSESYGSGANGILAVGIALVILAVFMFWRIFVVLVRKRR